MYTANRVSTVKSAFCPSASRRSAQWAYASKSSRMASRSAASTGLISLWTAIRATPLISARYLRILAFASKQFAHPHDGEEPPIACKSKLVLRGHMAAVDPLSPSEEEMWLPHNLHTTTLPPRHPHPP